MEPQVWTRAGSRGSPEHPGTRYAAQAGLNVLCSPGQPQTHHGTQADLELII